MHYSFSSSMGTCHGHYMDICWARDALFTFFLFCFRYDPQDKMLDASSWKYVSFAEVAQQIYEQSNQCFNVTAALRRCRSQNRRELPLLVRGRKGNRQKWKTPSFQRIFLPPRNPWIYVPRRRLYRKFSHAPIEEEERNSLF